MVLHLKILHFIVLMQRKKMNTKEDTFDNILSCGLGYFLNKTLNNQNFAFEFGICDYQGKDPININEMIMHCDIRRDQPNSEV